MAWCVEHLSSELAEALAQFQEEEMGDRPAEVSVAIGADLVMVHLKDVLTPSERSLARTEKGARATAAVQYDVFTQGEGPSRFDPKPGGGRGFNQLQSLDW